MISFLRVATVLIFAASPAFAQLDPCFTAGVTGEITAGCLDTKGDEFAAGFRQSHPEARCWEASEASQRLGKPTSFTDAVRKKYIDAYGAEADSCKWDAEYLRKLCGVSLNCWAGGTRGYSLYPIAGLGLAIWRLGGGVQSVFNGFGLTSVKVGAGVKTWEHGTIFEQHAYAFFSTTKTSGASTTTPEDTYRFGIGVGQGFFNGVFSADLLWIALGDNLNARFLGGGLALSLNIDLASGALLGLAAIAPKKE